MCLSLDVFIFGRLVGAGLSLEKFVVVFEWIPGPICGCQDELLFGPVFFFCGL